VLISTTPHIFFLTLTIHITATHIGCRLTKLIFEDFYLTEKGGKKRDRKITKELTERENEILELVAQGIGNREISERLFISVRTAETHKTHVLDKLGLKNAAELIKYAIKHNIISIE
jgi:DNA-binding NarL/FixJ family response regulator